MATTRNSRTNPVDGSTNWTFRQDIVLVEYHTDKALYGFYLTESPRNNGTLVIYDITSNAVSGTTITVRQSGIPAAGEVTPDWENGTGWVWCNAAQLGDTFEVEYYGDGYALHEKNIEDQIVDAFDLPAFATAVNNVVGSSLTTEAVKGYLYGLTLSNNGTDPTNDIDVAVGSCVDSTNAEIMTLASAITKRLDAAWSVGTNQGGLDTGAIANTTYHVWLIKRSDTGVVDVLFSTSATSPTMPANYDYKRRIGSIIRVSAAILMFDQYGDEFWLDTPILDINAGSTGTSAVTRTLSVPVGITVQAILNVYCTGDSAGNNNGVYLSSLANSDMAASYTAAPLVILGNSLSSATSDAVQGRIWTNASGQIRSRNFATAAGTVLRISTLGWVDTRGRV